MSPRLLLLISVCTFGWAQVLPGFEKNEGQFPPAVLFASRTGNAPLFLTRDSAVIAKVRFRIRDLSPAASLMGDPSTAARLNLYLGSDSGRWREDLVMFETVRVTEVSPGVSARWRMPRGSEPLRLELTATPGADLSRFRLEALNSGTRPASVLGGALYVGGTVGGANRVGARAFSVRGGQREPIAATIAVESDDSLSVQVPQRDPAASTVVEIAIDFPVFFGRSVVFETADATYTAAALARPVDFGEYGSVTGSCGDDCQDAALVKADGQGRILWGTVTGGSRNDVPAAVTENSSGVTLAGASRSLDYPTTANAPGPMLGSDSDIFLSAFDSLNGTLRTSTYAGIGGQSVSQSASFPSGDIAIAGTRATAGGFILRWAPDVNRVLFRLNTDHPVERLAADSRRSLLAATWLPDPSGSLSGQLTLLDIDPAGQVTASARVPLLSGQAILPQSYRLAATASTAWLTYTQYLPPSNSVRGLPAFLAAMARPSGRLVFNGPILSGGAIQSMATTSAGNVKILAQNPFPTEPASFNATQTAGCVASAYFAVYSPSGELVSATYADPATFEFTAQNELVDSPAPQAVCLSATASRSPIAAIGPGELVTIVGGGFGPRTARYAAPVEGKFPREFDGFQVRVNGLAAPIVATARGLIAFQTPFESTGSGGATVEVLEAGRVIAAVSAILGKNRPFLFDNGDANNVAGVPALAALNEDGTVNGPDNPAGAGSIVTVFGSALPPLAESSETGGLNPQRAIPLGDRFRPLCSGCEVLYLGAAPGLSSGVFQANVRLTNAAGSVAGTHLLSIGITDAATGTGIRPPTPRQIVYVK